MKTTLLFLLLTFIHWTSAGNRASVSITPDSSQYFEYNYIQLKCQHTDSDDWTVWRQGTRHLRVSRWLPGREAKPSDSGVYWCQSKQGHSSNTVNITVTSGDVILQSPALPVAPGEDVTLRCKAKNPSDNRPADFYKDGALVSETPAAHMILRNFSKSDEGAYTCVIRGLEASQPSWLLIKDDLAQASLSASPDSSQLGEYESLSLSCGNNSRFDGWTINRFTASEGGVFYSCGTSWGTLTSSGCFIQTVKPGDSATYWCESPARQRSNSVTITVYSGDVILQSPALPVAAGEDVTLRCKPKNPHDSRPADFYKDGALISETPAAHMILHFVSKSDEGVYKCVIRGLNESQPSWLFVTDEVKGAAPFQLSLTMLVITRIVVTSPYVVSSLLLVSIGRQVPTEMALPVSLTTLPPGEDDEGFEYDDVDNEITTEHQF